VTLAVAEEVWGLLIGLVGGLVVVGLLYLGRNLAWVRRYIEFERRWGVPFNAFMVRVYDWLFVVLGPFAVVVGAYFLIRGYWIGALLIAIGAWMTNSGWRRAWRWITRNR
jgi:hypothetical protein